MDLVIFRLFPFIQQFVITPNNRELLFPNRMWWLSRREFKIHYKHKNKSSWQNAQIYCAAWIYNWKTLRWMKWVK